jgi:hypothetical protein
MTLFQNLILFTNHYRNLQEMLEIASFLKSVYLYLTSEWGRLYVGHLVLTVNFPPGINLEAFVVLVLCRDCAPSTWTFIFWPTSSCLSLEIYSMFVSHVNRRLKLVSGDGSELLAGRPDYNIPSANDRSLVSTVSDYGLDGRGSIPDRGRGFFL